MKVSLTVSVAAHALLLAWGLVSFTAKPFAAVPVDSLPVDIISDSEFSQLTSGIKTAPKVTTPKPLVEKVAAATPVKDLAPKVSAKPEIAAAADKPPPEPPKPPEKKPEPPKPPEKKVEAPKPPPENKPEARKVPEPKVDEIAEALEREQARKEQEAKRLEEKKRVEEARQREEQKKRVEEAKRREEQKKRQEEAKRRQELARQIEAKLALLDKQEARRHEATGASLNATASLGSPLGNAATLSQNELDALRAQLQACWNPPIGLAEAKELVVAVRIQFNRDGSLSADPTVMNRSANPLFQVAAETARRAVLRCQPYRLPVAKYDVWKDVEVNFDPREMFRG